ncbi:bifunctional Gfo/Idh/MocA family oxidoreductase/class I SAM-dependent methyltransferase [Pendulispora rubella]|uniref:Bifunctional Gfo/Idh/MocA family oxidoreductase/class I SAM-dependent methyltransferase n=1 Tax=Pendulispora rubella TaxID=2741070 RepID=A0ABZ2KWU4_9BACT|nr:SrbF [Sorangiineae bacterium]
MSIGEQLERGISVLVETPLAYDELLACMRIARRTGASLRVATVLERTPSARRFIAAVKGLQAPIRGANAACTRDDLHAVLALLGRAFGGVRPWRFTRGAHGISGRLAGVPIVLRVHEEPAPLELTLDHDAGALTFSPAPGEAVDPAAEPRADAAEMQHQLVLAQIHQAIVQAPEAARPEFPDPAAIHDAALRFLGGRAWESLPVALGRLEAISLRALSALLLERDEPEILAALDVAPRHVWLVRRWLLALNRAGRPSSGPELADPATLRDAYAALAFPPAMADLHLAALRALPQLLSDQTTLPRLLGSNAASALSAYQSNVFTAYLDAACDQLAQRRDAPRVLEVGRGNLDLDSDFAVQGVAPESVDVLIARNVLHNAAHIGRTLRCMRRALSAGGWLVFTDSTHENAAMLSAIMFLLSPPPGAPPLGAEDRRAGTGSPFVDTDGWRAELLAAGFAPQFELPPPNSPLAVAGQRLFFAVAL